MNYQAPLVNSYIPMDYPDVVEYVPQPPGCTVLVPDMPMLLDAYDAEPSPNGQYLDKSQVIYWALSTLKMCNHEPVASEQLRRLIAWLIDD